MTFLVVLVIGLYIALFGLAIKESIDEKRRLPEADWKKLPRLTNRAVLHCDKLMGSIETRVRERFTVFANNHPEMAVDVDEVETAYFQVINEEAERLNRNPD